MSRFVVPSVLALAALVRPSLAEVASVEIRLTSHHAVASGLIGFLV